MLLNLLRSLRASRKRVRELTELIIDLQFVQPTYNGGLSCTGCGNMKDFGCQSYCEVNNLRTDRHPTMDEVNSGATIPEEDE